MKIFTIITLLLFSHLSYAQNETNVWYFGDGAGLDFNVGSEPGVLEDGELNSFEGCSSICNSDGELLFYTDATTVYRSDHQVMTNGYDLNGSTNSIQSSIVVPSPANDGMYYLFTMDTDYILGGAYDGLQYSIIDMTQWFGYGAVTDIKNIPISDNPVYEGLTAVSHANGIDVWIITQEAETYTYEAYLLTADSLTTIPVQSDVTSLDPGGYQSTLKASPDALKIASVYTGGAHGELLDFDSYTGQLSNAMDLEIDYSNIQDRAPYSCEFSNSGERLYVSHLDYGPIVQYDLTADDIPASRTDVGVNNGVSGNAPYCTLQLAPNGRIYAACYDEHFISAINLPNELAASCAFQDTAITFETKTSKFGLPQFVQSSFVEDLFAYTKACRGDTVFFTPLNLYDSIYWNFGDPISGDANYSTEEYPYHIYEEVGIYTATMVAYLGIDSLTSVKVINTPGPQLELGLGDTVCTGDKVTIDATTPGAISYLWFDDTSDPTIKVTPPGKYWVTVDEGLCVSTDTIEFWSGDCAFMEYPNIITPNNDGVNETFIPVRSWHIKEFEIKIYDRWGLEVFYSTDFEIGWDGTNKNGKDVADGTYYYIIRYSGIEQIEKEIKSTLQVTRTRNR